MKICKGNLIKYWKRHIKNMPPSPSKDKAVKQSFKQWLKDNGKIVVLALQATAEGELDFSDEALKLIEEFI